MRWPVETFSHEQTILTSSSIGGGALVATSPPSVRLQLGFQRRHVWTNGKTKRWPAPGGTFRTNVGCIPIKALLQSSEHFEQASHHFADHGISPKT